MPEFSPMTNLVAVVHAWSEANSKRFELDGVAAEIPPVSTFSTGEATRFVLRRGAVKLQVFAWDTGDFVLHIEDAAHMERKSTLAIKIKAGDEAVPIIEDRYSRVFANSVPRNVGAPEHARVEPLEPDDQREPPPANIAVPAPAAVIEEVPAPAQETLEVSEAEVTPDKVFARNMCLVCGYDGLHAPPFDENGVSNQEICPCCGFQFGYDDTRRGVLYEDARKRWVAAGMRWFSQSVNKPRFWDAAVQLRKIDGSG